MKQSTTLEESKDQISTNIGFDNNTPITRNQGVRTPKQQQYEMNNTMTRTTTTTNGFKITRTNTT